MTYFKQVQLDKLFLSKPFSLALATDSPLRMDEPQYEGIKRLFLKLMMFYSKQSKHIRGANVIYRRIVSQVEKPAIYDGNYFSSSLDSILPHLPHHGVLWTNNTFMIYLGNRKLLW